MTPALVVFDLDGTLLDTHADLVDSLNHTIDFLQLAPLAYADLTYLVGHGAKVMIERACALRGHPLHADELPALLTRFVDHYKANMPGHTVAYPGLVEAMDRLLAAGMRLAVCTNKMEQLAVPLLEKLGLTRYFDAITGGDTFDVRKPDAGHLIGTVEKAGGSLERSIMIGDSVNDMLVARNARVASIGVTFGYSDVPVDTLGPSYVMSDYAELTPALVEELLQANKARPS